MQFIIVFILGILYGLYFLPGLCVMLKISETVLVIYRMTLFLKCITVRSSSKPSVRIPYLLTTTIHSQ